MISSLRLSLKTTLICIQLLPLKPISQEDDQKCLLVGFCSTNVQLGSEKLVTIFKALTGLYFSVEDSVKWYYCDSPLHYFLCQLAIGAWTTLFMSYANIYWETVKPRLNLAYGCHNSKRIFGLMFFSTIRSLAKLQSGVEN